MTDLWGAAKENVGEPVALVVIVLGWVTVRYVFERYPLGRRLLERGLLRADPLRLGVQTTNDGRVIDRNGTIDAGIVAVGVLRRGSLYESTAVPELRAQMGRTK